MNKGHTTGMGELKEGTITIRGIYIDEDYDDEGLRNFTFVCIDDHTCNGELCVKKEWIKEIS